MTQPTAHSTNSGGGEIFYSSDLHFGHRNIVSYTGRPYADVETMDFALVGRWNSVVGPNDIGYIIGDVAMGKIDNSLALVAELNGTLILIPGNHDRCWIGHKKGYDKWRERYLAAGFTFIDDNPEPVTIGGQHCLRSHFPYQGGGDSQGVERYSEHRHTDQGSWLLCGHVHDAWRQQGRQINVGIDAWGGYPVHVDALAELVEAGPRELAPLPWQ